MVNLKLTSKRLQINRAQTIMVAAVAAAAFITIFSLVASKALLSQRAYQAKVIDAKNTTNNTLKENINTLDKLRTQYKAFKDTPTNILGGNPSSATNGELDGDNPRIILDALPSKYDFPALATSLEKILIGRGLQVETIAGIDEEVAQAVADAKSEPIEIPFQFGIKGTYTDAQRAVDILKSSIRPIRIKTMGISGEDKELKLLISGVTYYQPTKKLKITTEEIK